MTKANDIEGKSVPRVTLKTRICEDGGVYVWKDIQSDDLFNGKKVILFALPGAFTPTCSATHLPGYEAKYDELKELGIDEVYCISVNDAFVMYHWGKHQGVKKVKLIPDGNADFTREMGMLIKKENLGFGKRSWRYSMYVEDGVIKKAFVESGFSDDCVDDPFEVSDAETMLTYLKENHG